MKLKDDPAALEERKHFFELLDKGDPDALERWKAMAQRRQGGGERPAQ
jgi:multidrug efflux system membrane fusion protein